MGTIRALLAVVAMNQWHTCQIDVQITFLHGDLKEYIYMQSSGIFKYKGAISDDSSSRLREFAHLVCKLKKALYGAGQAGT